MSTKSHTLGKKRRPVFQSANVVSNPAYLESAWLALYQRLAELFAGLLRSNTGHLVEIGCGRGQLTIPLSRLVANSPITIVDKFAGPYSKDYESLRAVLAREKLGKRVDLEVSDYSSWLLEQPDNKYDAMISNEFLCEIDSIEMRRFLLECHRVLRPTGVTIHGFLSPQARNARQRLLIQADSDPKWAKYPPKEWFSPQPKSVADQLRRTGFRRVRTRVIRNSLVIKAGAAQQLLTRWDFKESFWKLHQERLIREGLEIPDWVVVAGFRHR